MAFIESPALAFFPLQNADRSGVIPGKAGFLFLPLYLSNLSDNTVNATVFVSAHLPLFFPLSHFCGSVYVWACQIGLCPWGGVFSCLTSQQHASVSQGRIWEGSCTCCHTEIEVADQTFHLTQSQYTDIGPTSPSTDPISQGTWQGSQFLSHWYDSTPKKSRRKRDSNLGSSALEADTFGQRGGCP